MRPVALGALSILALASACSRRNDPCPAGLRLLESKSKPPLSLFCVDETKRKARWFSYYPTGEKQHECLYENGLAQGPFKSWHKNGARWIEGRYDGGVKRGTWTQWARNGEKTAEGDYRDGQLVGGAPVGLGASCENHKLP